MSESKTYYCKVCKRLLVPRETRRTMVQEDERYVSLHHIDYQKNIAIRVCKECHNKLHTTMKKHKYGLNNVIRKDGTKRGRVPHGEYPKKILE